MNAKNLFQPWINFEVVHKLHRDQVGVYLLSHKPTDKVYIGACGDLYGSLHSHASWLRNDTHYCKSMQTLYREDPRFEVQFTPTGVGRSYDTARAQANELKYELLDEYAGSTLLLNTRMGSGSRQARPVRVADRLFPSLNAAARHVGVSAGYVKMMVEDDAFALWEYAVTHPETSRMTHVN